MDFFLSSNFVDTLPVARTKLKLDSLLKPLLLTEKGNPSFSQTSLYQSIFGRTMENAHRADADIRGLKMIIESPNLIEAFLRVTPSKIKSIFNPETGRKIRTPREPCPECKKKIHRSSNPCSLKKK